MYDEWEPLLLPAQPPVQYSAARALEPPSKANALNSRANQRTNNKPAKPNTHAIKIFTK
jgi:hypothetical protein